MVQYAPIPIPETEGPARFIGESNPIQVVLGRITDLIGVMERHQNQFFKTYRDLFSVGVNPAAGLQVYGPKQIQFSARSLVIDNPSGCTLRIPELMTLIPPSTYGYIVPCDAALPDLNIIIDSGSNSAAVVCYVRATEAYLMPQPVTL